MGGTEMKVGGGGCVGAGEEGNGIAVVGEKG